MPPPTKSAWLFAMVVCEMVTELAALIRMAPPRPELPLLGGMPVAEFPVKVLLLMLVGEACSSQRAPPCPRVVLPANVLRAMVSAPFWW